MGDGDGTVWTLQDFTYVAGKPWYALQQHSDAGVQRQYTGYDHEMTALCRTLRLTPERLPPTTEEEFLKRAMEQQGEGPPPIGRTHAMTRQPDAHAALQMLDAFACVGAENFHVTWTDRNGDKPGYRKEMPVATMKHLLPDMLAGAVKEEKNLIVRPLSRPAVFIQLDDLDAAKMQQVQGAAFLCLQSSPGNYQAWLAMPADTDKDFVRRLRKGAGADDTASGSTRVAGSINFKDKYAPNFPRVEIAYVNH